MENPRDAKLSEIRQLREYNRQLTIMLPYVVPRLRKHLKAELTTLEEQINELQSEIRPDGRDRPGPMS